MNLYRVVYDSGSYFVEAPSFGKAIKTWQNWAAKNWEDDGWEGTEQPESVERLDSDHRVIRVEGPPVYKCVSCGHPLTSLQGPPYYACEWNPCPRFYLLPTAAPSLGASRCPRAIGKPAHCNCHEEDGRSVITTAPELDDERRVVQNPANRQNWVARAFF